MPADKVGKSEASNIIRPGERVDTLSNGKIIIQPEVGQRYTTDDVLTAWLAVRTAKESMRPVNVFLDLGSGLCSVPMILLANFASLRGVGVEIDSAKTGMAMRSLTVNGFANRFQVINRDIRDLSMNKNFDMVSSTPPYYESAEGPLSPDSQKASSRFELKGGIEDFFAAAKRHLIEGGAFVTVYPWQYKIRVFEAAENVGFSLDREVDIFPKEFKPRLITLFSFVNSTAGRHIHEELSIRTSLNIFTPEFMKLRHDLGFPDKET